MLGQAVIVIIITVAADIRFLTLQAGLRNPLEHVIGLMGRVKRENCLSLSQWCDQIPSQLNS
jgi:hypothetical protein